MCNLNEELDTEGILELLVEIKISKIGFGSNGRSLILRNSKDNNLHHLFDVSELYGVHTVNSAGELIYVDKDWNINKLSADNSKKLTLIKRTERWEPWLHYNQSKPYNTTKKGKPLYHEPVYITENRNEDIVVSDIGKGVVVTDREGKYRFTYTGPPEGLSLFMPCGICVDAFLNILICGRLDQTIQMINKDGLLLSILPTEQDGMVQPLGLGYDGKNHLVWMGSGKTNRLCVYRYIERQDYLA
ncbi:uncharacterized protein LOC134279592 [Saccostrea cucullata]|uniref:uncharacterized protein LOC134279592 n=1 Tax=Saccostrea cuccullata TaxID=36930 RepID=UPI002ED64B36